jgi:hypothetical protein
VRLPAGRHGFRGGPQRLGGDLTAEQPARLLGHDDRAEQVILDPLQIQDLGQPGLLRGRHRLHLTDHGPLISQRPASLQ